MQISHRLKRIQKAIGVEPDGILGPITLTKLEQRLSIEGVYKEKHFSLVVSQKSIDLILESEGFRARPYQPSPTSGVTIGYGYDCGYQTVRQIKEDWSEWILTASEYPFLLEAAGLTGDEAQRWIRECPRTLRVSKQMAQKVFYTSTLPRYAAMTRKAYPALIDLPQDAQGAILSLVYNRGASKVGESRKEMKALSKAITASDLDSMAELILDMRRLWKGKGLKGLLRRREKEAQLVRDSLREYTASELVWV